MCHEVTCRHEADNTIGAPLCAGLIVKHDAWRAGHAEVPLQEGTIFGVVCGDIGLQQHEVFQCFNHTNMSKTSSGST